MFLWFMPGRQFSIDELDFYQTMVTCRSALDGGQWPLFKSMNSNCRPIRVIPEGKPNVSSFACTGRPKLTTGKFASRLIVQDCVFYLTG